ncbi:hypothetical protein BD769DRAFT_1534054 [Suillus cothurnatus]|nr:hypothetical protein BD769DRAFT_1534054 [Suillus cothurnatus]
MQLTLFASLAVLCSTVFAAPLEARYDQLAEGLTYVRSVGNVLTRDESLIDVVAYVENVLNDADVNVLTRDDSAAQLTAQLTAEVDRLESLVQADTKFFQGG